MNVTLKKAAALASALSGITTAVPTALSFSIYSDADIDIVSAIEERDQALEAALVRAEAVYAIRGLIGRANEGRINELLTERALIDKQLQIVNAVPVVKMQPDVRAAKVQAEALRNDTNSYRSTTSVTIALPFDPQPVVKAMKKRRIAIEDELAQLNFSTMIKLPDNVVEILRDNDLI